MSFCLLFAIAVGCGRSGNQLQGNTSAARNDQFAEAQIAVLPALFSSECPELSHSFTISNDSPSDLDFREVRKSCTCTQVHIKSLSIKHGTSATLTLTAALRGRVGPQTFTCSLIPIDGSKPRLFSCITRVYQPVVADRSGVKFGIVAPGEQRAKTLSICTYSWRNGTNPKLLSIDAPPMLNVSTESSAIAINADGVNEQRLSVSVGLRAPGLPGRHDASVQLHFQSHNERVPCVVPVTWVVRSVYEIEPNALFFVVPANNRSPSRKAASIRRSDGQQFRILSVRHFSQLVLSDSTNESARHQRLVVGVDGTRLRSSIRGEILIETDCVDEPTLRLPVSVFFQGDDRQSQAQAL